jgi:ubiquinone/menaquinone biosynthesis C-methylase UbiE
MGTPTDRWEEVYRTSEVSDLPWYTPELDTDFERALVAHLPTGARILDLGTGPATQAIALAKRGYEVVATDIAPSAIRKATHTAERQGARIDFRVDNVLESKLPDALVDGIVDRGVFHTLDPASRPRYVATVHRILRPRGFLFLKAFSDKEPWSGGPHRFSRPELRRPFETSFEVLSVEDATFRGPNARPQALIAVFRRRGATAFRAAKQA